MKKLRCSWLERKNIASLPTAILRIADLVGIIVSHEVFKPKRIERLQFSSQI
jgi:hypothetical protein